MGRTDFFFAFCYKGEIHRQFFSRGANCMQRRQESRLRSFLIYRTTADNHFSEIRFIYQRRVGRWRSPFRRVELFHVVHEINADSFGGTGIERSENARLALGRHLSRLVKPCFLQQFDQVVRAFGVAAIFRRDRDLMNPFLQPLHRLIMLLGDLLLDIG